MGVRDWFTRDTDDGSDDSGQWWETESFKGHPDEGLFHYRLSSAPDDGTLYGTWHQIAEGGSAGAWGPFPPYGGQVFDGPRDAPRWGDWGDGWGDDA